MRSGRLRHIITVERHEQTGTDDFGTPILEWSQLTTLRADVERQATEEFMRAQGAVDETTVVFHARVLDGLATADRIVWQGQTYSIREIAPDSRHREMELRTVALGYEQ